MKIKQITACLLLGSTALAAQAADNFFRLGYTDITVHSKSADLTSNGPAFLTPQPAGLTVQDAQTVTFAYTRRLDDHWDAEFILGVPPSHKVNGRGTLAPFGEVSHIKQAAPTAFLDYNFFSPDSAFRPFVGLGVNFTHFYDSTSTAAGNLASGGPTKIQLTNSTGLAAQIGFSYKLNKDWSIVSSVAMAKVETDLTAITGSIERKTQLDLRPVVYSIGVAYGF